MTATSLAALTTSSAFIASPLIQATPLPDSETETGFGKRLRHRSCQPRCAKALATSRPTPPVAPIINAVFVMPLTRSPPRTVPQAEKSLSKFPADLALGGMVLRGARELAGIGQREAGVAREIEASACLDQQGIARDRHAPNRERRAAAAERQQRFRGHVAECMPPAERAAHGQRLAIR